VTPNDAATVLCCPLCRGPVRARPKPWRFACDDCALTWRPDDIGSLQRSIMRRVLAGPGAAGQPIG
jgi:hypothetical protein